MSELGVALRAVPDGLLLGLQFNPLVAVITVALAAAVAGVPKVRAARSRWAVPVVLTGWLLGDGLRVLGRARDFHDGVGMLAGAPPVRGWTVLAVWALCSLAIGYLAPALTGAAIGRRVTHGTGWLAAAGTAVALVLAISGAVGALS